MYGPPLPRLVIIGDNTTTEFSQLLIEKPTAAKGGVTLIVIVLGDDMHPFPSLTET